MVAAVLPQSPLNAPAAPESGQLLRERREGRKVTGVCKAGHKQMHVIGHHAVRRYLERETVRRARRNSCTHAFTMWSLTRTDCRRAYVAQPRPWQYPAGSDVRRVDRSGSIRCGRQRLFIGDALIDEEVAVLRLASRLLVLFRDLYVRELQLRIGRTRSLLRPMDAGGPVDAQNASTRSSESAQNAFSTAPTGELTWLTYVLTSEVTDVLAAH